MYVVKVIAPATLDAGYKFDASVDGKTFTVTVPEHVEEGEEFEVPYPMDEELPTKENESDTPTGKWRYSLCSCCDVVTQATFWMACFLGPIHLAQIMTRMNLNWKGAKGTQDQVTMTFNILVIIFVLVLYMWMIPIMGTVAAVLFFIFILFIGSKTRGQMREKYEIPKGLCGIFGEFADDCCSMFWCGCCTMIQMARHTHDDKEYPGSCWSSTGLELDAPEILATFSSETISESGTVEEKEKLPALPEP